MADALLTVRRCAIRRLVGEDTRPVDQFVVVGWLGCHIVESRASWIVMSVVWC